MGNNGSRVIEVDDVQDKLDQLQSIQQKQCPPYGVIHYVAYNDMQFFISESQTGQEPHPMSLHYFVPPNLLIISEFTLLEQINPSSLDNLLQIIAGISEMVYNGGIAGIGYNRIAYAGRWGIVGEQPINWAYRQVLETEDTYGVYLSPQQMISLSQGKTLPKHNPQKSDIFALGIMLVQMIFQEKLDQIFDYQNYEIRLKPLLEKLYLIRQEYGDTIYEMFVAMLEIEENDRIGFEELFSVVDEIRKKNRMASSKMSSSSYSRGSRTPTRANRPEPNAYNRTPKGRQDLYRNDVSPLRGRFGGNAKVPQRVGKTPERERMRQQHSRSPLRRDLKINTQFGRESQNIRGYGESRRILSPISRR